MDLVFHCAAILFDLDGVLVDSTHSVARQWRIWAKEHNVDPDKVLQIAHGRRTQEVVQLLAPQLDAEGETRKLEAREAADTAGVALMRGAIDLVRSIPDGKWCVVTSGTRHLATSRLRLAGIPIPRVLITADDVSHGKPHPEPYLKGAELLGIDAREGLVIEDAPAGIEAAHVAGMKVIAVPSTYPGAELKQADAVAESVAGVRAERYADSRLVIHVDSLC